MSNFYKRGTLNLIKNSVSFKHNSPFFIFVRKADFQTLFQQYCSEDFEKPKDILEQHL